MSAIARNIRKNSDLGKHTSVANEFNAGCSATSDQSAMQRSKMTAQGSRNSVTDSTDSAMSFCITFILLLLDVAAYTVGSARRVARM